MPTVRLLSRLAIAVSLVIAASTPLHAQAGSNPFIFLPETGAGTIQFPGGSLLPLPGVRAPDPGPGGSGSALTYNLGGPPSLVAGDLFLWDGTSVTDLLRFNPAGTGSAGYVAAVVFYSELEGSLGSLADTGFPSLFYDNKLLVNEGPAGLTYTPTADQPGYIAGYSVTYGIESIATVPEPGTVALLATGLMGLMGFARDKRRAS